MNILLFQIVGLGRLQAHIVKLQLCSFLSFSMAA
jgi:hypothetical protein